MAAVSRMSRIAPLLVAGLLFSVAGKKPQQDMDLGELMKGFSGMLGGLDQGGGEKGGPKDEVCPFGKVVVPKMNQHTFFAANGCGPQGMQIKESFGLHRCCNGHDVCFSVCGTSHKFCEDEFSSCMKQVCKKPLSGKKKACKEQAQSFSSMTRAFGQGFHHSSQRETCDCVQKADGSAEAQRQREYLETFYSEFNKTAAVAEVIDSELAKWKGREAELHFENVKTYGKQFVRFIDIEGEFFQPVEKVESKASAEL
ncbi:unnamed protein product [Polarella glacialis]|nr:unnamed protein product [Polarella glacialis]